MTREGGKAKVVLVAEAEFEGWAETAHLLRDLANAQHLLMSIRQAEAGLLEEHDLLPIGSSPD